MRRRRLAGVIVACVAMLCMAALGSCSGQKESFVESGDTVTGSSYEQLATAILADGTVTRAEAEQSINALAQCYEEGGLAGEYGYDLDEEPWYQGSSLALSKSHPLYHVVEDPQSKEGTNLINEQGDAIGEIMQRCIGYFDEVHDTYIAHIDENAYHERKAQGIYRCFITKEPKWGHLLDPVMQSVDAYQAINDFLLKDNDLPDDVKPSFYTCARYGSAIPKSFGAS